MTQESTPLYQGKGSQTGTQTTAPANTRTQLLGGAGDDLLNFYSGKGTQTVDGGAGTDTLRLNGDLSLYQLKQDAQGWVLQVGSEQVRLKDIEQLKLGEQVLSLEQAAQPQVGGAGDDQVWLLGGQTRYDGGAGLDTVAVQASYGASKLQRVDRPEGSLWIVEAGGQRLELKNIEALRFSDITVDLRGQSEATVQALQTRELADGLHLIGSELSYSVVASGLPAGNHRLEGRGGDDILWGGRGTDTAVYRGALADYEIVFDTTTQTATVRDKQAGRDGLDTLASIEKLQFADGLFDLQAVAKLVASDPLVLYTVATLVSGSAEDGVIHVAGEDQPTVFSPEPGFPAFEGSARLQLVGSWGEQGIPDLP